MLRSHLCAKRKRDSAQRQVMERTEWSLIHNVSECVLKMARERPPRLRRFDASRHFLDGAATPPHEEGNNPLDQQFIHSSYERRISGGHSPPLQASSINRCSSTSDTGRGAPSLPRCITA